MVTIQGDLPLWVDLNHHHITKVTIPTGTNLMQHGVQVVMDLSTVTEVLEDVRVL
jgi:hypothetical protein